MCGIAGIIALKSVPGAASDPLDRIAERMAKCLAHRGPDGSGVWKSPSGRVALAHRRLAIIDLTDGGRQPMEYAGRFWTTFNGEIHSFRELRQQLHALGHAFRSENDTEILLATIAQRGIEGALRRCVGMFALAVWDARDQLLHLARDHMGEKPLYLGEFSVPLVFASELRAFRALPAFEARISRKAANAHLRDGCVPGALSMYDGVYKLPPGHIVTVGAGRDQRLPVGWPHSARGSTLGDLKPRAYRSCRDALMMGRESRARIAVAAPRLPQWHADVPTGAFLSGGIDSSLATAVMQHQSSQPVRTSQSHLMIRALRSPGMRAPSRPTWVPGTRNSRCASRRSSSRYRRSLPLLDHRLVEFSWRPPASLKLQGRTTKWLLRAILDRYVPRAGAGPSANEMWALAMLSAWAESTASNGSTAEVPVQSAAVCNEP